MLQLLEGFTKWLFFENCYTSMVKEFPMCASPNSFCECLDLRVPIIIGLVVMVPLMGIGVRALTVRNKV